MNEKIRELALQERLEETRKLYLKQIAINGQLQAEINLLKEQLETSKDEYRQLLNGEDY